MKILLAALISMLFSCVSYEFPSQVADQPASGQSASQSIPDPDRDGKYTKLLRIGYEKIRSKHPREAIDNCFNPIIKTYEEAYSNVDKYVYCSRDKSEQAAYLEKAAEKKEECIILSKLWADAYFYKGYAYLDLGMPEAAKTSLDKALEFSPLNSGYIAERAHIYQMEKQWAKALDLFEFAEATAILFTPEAKKRAELTRAMRGIGFSLIELGKLDEAEAKFKECLEIDSNDRNSIRELNYIKQLRKKTSLH